ncbi:hypothetical protein HRR84_006816 [Exophiala dermatitidis]|nr:hypothetical protein HRR84_006816 [Exophiala dermatitidis]KAJ4639574.1 hypothetical protein HRR89_004892 [Exophiala dermatitidis]
MRQHVAKFRAKGYLGHSVKLDGVPKKDAERIAASLADKEPGEFFIVDANGGLTVETALRPRGCYRTDGTSSWKLLVLHGENTFLSGAGPMSPSFSTNLPPTARPSQN